MFIFDINNTLFRIFGYPLSYVECLGTIMGIFSVWYAAKYNILTWSTGIVNVICFFAVFYQVNLYADMFLQVFFMIASIYGWLNWKKNRNHTKHISRLNNKQRKITMVILTLSTVLFGYLVKNIHTILPDFFTIPAAYPFADTFIAIASILATILLAKQKLENWILWISADVLSVFIYAKKNIMLISIEYALFFLLATYGLYSWINTLKNDYRFSAR